MSGKWWFDSPSSQGFSSTSCKPVGFRLRPAQPVASPLWLQQLPGVVLSGPPPRTLWRPDEPGESEPFGAGISSRPATFSGSNSVVDLASLGLD